MVLVVDLSQAAVSIRIVEVEHLCDEVRSGELCESSEGSAMEVAIHIFAEIAQLQMGGRRRLCRVEGNTKVF